MRCKNCGWENGAGQLKCEKCNAPLNGSMVESSSEPKHNNEEQESFLRGTISETEVFVNPNGNYSSSITEKEPQREGQCCKKCGYSVSPNMKVCPVCGTYINQADDTREHPSVSSKKCPYCGNEIIPGTNFCSFCGKPLRMGTVKAGPAFTPGSHFTLKALQWDNENIQYQPMSYIGDSVVLNRANTDPNNNSITSNIQAIISKENEKWFIEDKSSLQTTFVRVNGKIEIHNGDVIVLGNRMFEFNG